MNRPRFEQELSRRAIDAVIVTSPENTEYFAGFSVRTQLSIRDRLVVGVVPSRGEQSLIVCDIEESLARARVPGGKVLAYVEFQTKPVELLRDVLQDMGLAAGVLGVEVRHLTAEDYQLLEKLLPEAKLVPVDDALETIRAIKTPEEIATFRSILAKTEEGLIRAWTAASIGDTEQEIEAAMRSAFVEAGAQGTRHCTIAIGENAVHAHHTSGSRKLGRGDIVRTDFGALFGRYGTDMARMGVGAKPSPELAKFYSRSYDIHMQLVAQLLPGTIAADVYNLAVRLFDEAGIQFDLPHIGHSLRIDGGHENPILHPNNNQRLETNMLIALEPIPRAPGGELCGTEDVFLVTAEGPEPLTGASDPSRLFPMGH